MIISNKAQEKRPQIFLFLVLLLVSNTFFAQVGINTINPDASAALDIQSTDGGLLIPRMTATDRAAISTPAEGLMVYQTTNPKGFWYYDGSTWSAVGSDSDGWKKTGNAGTDATTDFIGTTDDEDVIFKRNNLKSGILSDDNTVFGVGSFLNAAPTVIHSTAIGVGVLEQNTTGQRNIGVGNYSLRYNTTGGNNVAVGYEALRENRTGIVNSALGGFALRDNTSGRFNTALGYVSSGANETGDNNSSLGYFSLTNNRTGSSNTAIGSFALSNNVTGSDNTAIGKSSGPVTTNLENTSSVGANAQVDVSNAMVLGSINGVNGATASVNVGIGTTSPDPTAALDIQSTERGVLIPRMTAAQRGAISSPAEGLLVYQTDKHRRLLVLRRQQLERNCRERFWLEAKWECWYR